MSTGGLSTGAMSRTALGTMLPGDPKVTLVGAETPLGRAVARRLTDRFDTTLLLRRGASPPVPESSVVRRANFASLEQLTQRLDDQDALVVVGTPAAAPSDFSQGELDNRRYFAVDSLARAAAEAGIERIAHVAATAEPTTTSSLQLLDVVNRLLSSQSIPVRGWYCRIPCGPGLPLNTVAENLRRHPPRVGWRWLDAPFQPVPSARLAELVVEWLDPSNFDDPGEVFYLASDFSATLRDSLRSGQVDAQRDSSTSGESRALVANPGPQWRLPFCAAGHATRRWGPDTDASRALFDALCAGDGAPDLPKRWHREELEIPAVQRNFADSEEVDASTRLPAASANRRGADSVQVYTVERGRDAEWAADLYFDWLDSRLSPFLFVDRDDPETVCFRLGGFGTPLLVLEPVPTADPQRSIFRVTGGLVARQGGDQRFEFRTHPIHRDLIVALVGFRPALPNWLYRTTHALVHGIIMWLFGRHLAKIYEAPKLEE